MVDVILGADDAGDTVEIILVQDESDDEFLALLHELALEAIALRAHSPGDPRPEVDADQAQDLPAPDEGPGAWLVHRLGRRRLARWAVIAVAAIAVAIAPGVVDSRRAAARLAALEASPGVLEQATRPPVELWRTPGRLAGDQADAPLVAGADEPSGTEEYVLPDGARVTWSWDPDQSSGEGSVTGTDGVRAFGLSGPPVVPALTDGSAAGTLVVMTTDGERLIGRDLRTGRNQWSLTYRGALPVHAAAQVSGVMLLDDGAMMTAIDVRTGNQLWSAQLASDVTQGAALIDGRVVLLPVHTDGADMQLVARRIADGAPFWRTSLPAGTVSLAVEDHQLVATTGDARVGLG